MTADRRAKPSLGAVNSSDWVILGAALLALIFSFFAFYSYDPTGAAKHECALQGAILTSADRQLCSGDDVSAWHGLFGWFGVVLIVLGALAVLVAVFSPQVSRPVPVRLAGAGLAALGSVLVLVALFFVPEWPPALGYGLSGRQYESVIADGVGFSWYVVLALGLVTTALSWLRFRQTRVGTTRSGHGCFLAGGCGAG